ncbi:hypothetical protein A0H81_09701, partial [Grifola frondosa]
GISTLLQTQLWNGQVSEPNSQDTLGSEKEYIAPSLTVPQEEFHSYASVAYTPIVPLVPVTANAVDDAREAFLLELSSFHLSLKKNLMVCEAEARQVEEYQRERERIESEHDRLRGQIEQLKTTLEHAQLERKQKIEYDVIAEKVNSLPSRDELRSAFIRSCSGLPCLFCGNIVRSILSLENDMAAIRAEHENQDRTIQTRKGRWIRSSLISGYFVF